MMHAMIVWRYGHKQRVANIPWTHIGTQDPSLTERFVQVSGESLHCSKQADLYCRAAIRISRRPIQSKHSQTSKSSTPLRTPLLAETRLKSPETSWVRSGMPRELIVMPALCLFTIFTRSGNSKLVARLYATDFLMTGPVCKHASAVLTKRILGLFDRSSSHIPSSTRALSPRCSPSSLRISSTCRRIITSLKQP